MDPSLPQTDSKCFDDDGRLKRTGTIWTASAHVITAVIGSGVLSLAWATAQLGWIAGPACMFLFAYATYYTAALLADCYRSGDPLTGKRNYTYMDAVRTNLGGTYVKVCGTIQYVGLVGISIGYTIASATSMMAIERNNCFYRKGNKDLCHPNSNPYMIGFGFAEIIFSQIPGFKELRWLSVLAAVMSFTYSTIGLGLGIAKVAETGKFGGNITGVSVGVITATEKMWRTFHALGDLAFAYSFSIILIEVQDTLKSPPAENKTMKRAAFTSIAVTTVFYLLCGGFGYAAFGNAAPGNLLTGFYKPYWLVDIANAALVIHLVGAYQVYCQPVFAFVEKKAAQKFPDSDFIKKEIQIPLPGFKSYNLNLFRLVWRSSFVIMATVISMCLPFFNHIVGLLGAMGFWPLTVYFPVEMYIVQKKIPKWSAKWIWLRIFSLACLLISVAAAAGSIAGTILDLKTFKPFKSRY
ncbi:Amino acid permease [Melia azedarach]|nr:Amino acid permease [Melia azedarach]